MGLLKEHKFEILINLRLIKTLGLCHATLVLLIEHMVAAVPATLWAENEKQDGKAMDCWLIEVLNLNTKKNYTVECIPYPRGIVRFGIRGDARSLPARQDADAIVIAYPGDMERLKEEALQMRMRPSTN